MTLQRLLARLPHSFNVDALECDVVQIVQFSSAITGCVHLFVGITSAEEVVADGRHFARACHAAVHVDDRNVA